MAKRNGSSGGVGEQTEILRAIWNEMKGLRSEFKSEISTMRTELGGRIDAVRTELGGRIDQTNARLEAVSAEMRGENGELRRVMTQSDVRLATALTELSGDVRTLSGLVRDWRDDHRRDRELLVERVGRIEKKVGLGG